MKQYRATILGDKYPMDFSVEASNWATAAARLVRLWCKRFKGSKTRTLTIKIYKV